MKISEVFDSGEPEGAAPVQEQEPAPQGQEPAQKPQGKPSVDGEINATPEEQEAYDKVILAASEVMYGDMNPEIIKMLQLEANDPPTAIARVATTIIVQLDDKSGGTIPEQLIFPAAAEIAEMTAELADAKKIFPVDDAVIQAAGQEMIPMIADEYGVPMEEIEAFMGQVPQEVAQKIGEQQSQVAVKARPGRQQGAPANGG